MSPRTFEVPSKQEVEMVSQFDRERNTRSPVLALALNQSQVDALAEKLITAIHTFFHKNMFREVFILQMIAFSAGWMWATYDDGWIRITLAIFLTWASLAGIAWVLIPAKNEVVEKVTNIIDSFADTDEMG